MDVIILDSKGLHSGHRERLRKRFLKTGFESFQEHEILELILFYALPRVNTNEISHRLMEKFGSISAVLDADIAEIAEVKGLSESSALLLKLLRDLSCKYALSNHPYIKFSSHDEINKYLSDYFSSINSEICLILNVTPQFELLNSVSLPSHKIISNEVSIREIAEIAINNGLHRIIIGQNHPNKPPLPSEEDYIVTRILTESLLPLGIEIYDHIICGGRKTFSMRNNGAFSFTSGVNI